MVAFSDPVRSPSPPVEPGLAPTLARASLVAAYSPRLAPRRWIGLLIRRPATFAMTPLKGFFNDVNLTMPGNASGSGFVFFPYGRPCIYGFNCFFFCIDSMRNV